MTNFYFISGILNPLDSPHHMRADDNCQYREGVVLDKPVKTGKGSFANVGLLKVKLLHILLKYLNSIVKNGSERKENIQTNIILFLF